MHPTLEDLAAWLPFLAAILLAFAAGFVFAQLCHGRTVTWPRFRRPRHAPHDRIDYDAR